MRRVYPFSAIVNQEDLKRALLLNAVRPDIGGVLIRGERGTAKSTAARALAALLPDVRVVADCHFGCDPDQVTALCDDCRARLRAGETLPVAERRTPFVDLPVSATEDRVVGTLDIEQALATGRRHFEPGLLAAANRGILYVDEVNLLDDHVVDVLLDAAAMGVNAVEREGVSFSHPARFILVGTMNPEEGDLRPQLTDRFGLSVDVRAVPSVTARAEVLRRRLAFDADPEGFMAEWATGEAGLRTAVARARDLLAEVRLTERDLWVAAEIASGSGVDGHRSELALLKAAQAHAALDGRTRLGAEDLTLGARLALPHRLRRGPFEMAALEPGQLEGLVAEALHTAPGGGEGEPGDEEAAGSPADPGPDAPEPPGDGPTVEGAARPVPGDAQAETGGSGRPVAGGEPFAVRPLDTSLEQMSRRATGRRSLTETETRRGRYVRARPVTAKARDVAFDATLRAAARRQGPLRLPARLVVEPRDLHDKVRVRKAGHLILFLVDASWSMATAERLAAAKGAVLSLLVDAYQRRDRVALAVFRRRGTEVVLPFTASVQLAKQRLAEVPVGGKTPLAHALWTADRLFNQARLKDPAAPCLLILLTDGAGNISLTGRPPAEEASALARALRRRGVKSVVIDLQDPLLRDPDVPTRQLAADLGGDHLTVTNLQAGAVADAVRERLVNA
jgi:magnesium chelatase subunit D